mmetsp:Transcript_6182/g.15344  ORF Transcript_6182/g.15344 Transcript_6182/m.15344 type:complete len:285 (+) Transcript_6182:302-1156(+)
MKTHLVEGVTGHLQGNGSVAGSDNVLNVESFLSGGVNEIVDGVTLVDLLHESINRHGLLPELQVSDQLVALSVVAESNIVVVMLRDDDVGHDSFSLVSSCLDLFSVLGRLGLQTHVLQRLQQRLLVEKLGLDRTEVTIEGGRSSSASVGRSKSIGTSDKSKDGSSKSLHGAGDSIQGLKQWQSSVKAMMSSMTSEDDKDGWAAAAAEPFKALLFLCFVTRTLTTWIFLTKSSLVSNVLYACTGRVPSLENWERMKKKQMVNFCRSHWPEEFVVEYLHHQFRVSF